MSGQQIKPELMSRPALIGVLREELSRRANGEMSICTLAAQTGMFCRGFRRFSDAELKERYGWISAKYPNVPRAELEDIADRWQMARQEVFDLPTSCDVQVLDGDSCHGWDDFSDEELATFIREITGRNIIVDP